MTSVSLLKDLSKSADTVRWEEFYKRYEPMMRAFLQTHFPSVDADDAIQNTMIALTKALPSYRYTPDRNGHFRNYLVGIVKHKAQDAVRRNIARGRMECGMPRGAEFRQEAPERDRDGDWRLSAMEAALEQMLADESIPSRNREVFRLVALGREKPDAVAARFGITCGNVYAIKSRMIDRLARLVDAMIS